MKITRKQVRLIRQMLRRAFGLTARSRSPAITMIASSQGIRIQATSAMVALAYQIPGEQEPDQLTIPYQALLDCEGTRNEVVTIQQIEEQILVEWTSDSIPHALRYPAEEADPFPELPETMVQQGGRLLSALRDAADTSEKAATRYALDHIRLRGSDGQIASTDGRQALVQSGFEFPWEEALLIPASNLFSAKEIQKCDMVSIGLTEDWVTIQAGPWTLLLKIDHEGRFPNLDDCIPERSQAVTTLKLADNDAEFLQRTLPQLPAAELHDRPITIDLNGAAIVRARGEDQPLTDVVLTNSQRLGDELRVSCNRDYLARAAKLGFREVYLAGQDSPAMCQDESRRYIWALFAKGSALEPSDQGVRIESPSVAAPRPAVAVRRHAAATQPKRPTGLQGAPQGRLGLIHVAAALRDRLRELITQTEDLVRQLEQTGVAKNDRSNLTPEQLQAIDA